MQDFQWTKDGPLLLKLPIPFPNAESPGGLPAHHTATSGAFPSASLFYRRSFSVLTAPTVSRVDVVPSPDNLNDLAADLDGLRTAGIRKVGEYG